MVAVAKNGAATKTKRATTRNGSGRASTGEASARVVMEPSPKKGTKAIKSIAIPPLKQGEIRIRLVGDRPMLTSNKLNIAENVAKRYGTGGKASAVTEDAMTPDEQYAAAFYVFPDSKVPAPHPKGRYGIPASGIKKCACAAIRTTGITDNTTIGLISNSFWVLADSAGLCEMKFQRLVRDERAATLQSGAPQMRYRPMFHGWSIDLRIKFNAKVLGPEQIINLFMHAGQYIGLCEMRAQKKQGECGGFVVQSGK